jgi:hypothetical protein
LSRRKGVCERVVSERTLFETKYSCIANGKESWTECCRHSHIPYSAYTLLEKYGAFILNRGSTGQGRRTIPHGLAGQIIS